MPQENATANTTDDVVPAANSPRVKVVVQPPVADPGPLKLRGLPQGDGKSCQAPGTPTRTPAGMQIAPPARSGDLARSIATGASNRRFGRIWYVPTAAIHPTPTQLRKHLSTDELQTLAHSIREKGVAQPILLRCRRGTADAFELIAGHRRWRAAILAGLTEVPAIVIDRIGDKEALELALVENLQRRDLSVLEEAEAFRIMIEEHGQTHEQIAAVSGRSRSHVSNILRLLGLPAEVKEMIDSGLISFGHARALLAAESPGRLAARIVEEQLTVRETERIANTVQTSDPPSPTPRLSLPAAAQARPSLSPQDVDRIWAEKGPAAEKSSADAAAASRPENSHQENTLSGALATLQAEIAQELEAQDIRATVEIKTNAQRSEVCIHMNASQDATAAARTIRDALQLLNMSRAMRRLAGGSGRLG